jgi:hypothetical protein
LWTLKMKTWLYRVRYEFHIDVLNSGNGNKAIQFNLKWLDPIMISIGTLRGKNTENALIIC